jgi:hypothetical protein
MFDQVISAIDALVQFVADHSRISQADFPQLAAMDQELCARCRVAGLEMPPVALQASYGNDRLSFCQLPIIRDTGGIILCNDPAWRAAMLQGLRLEAALRRDREGETQQETSPTGDTRKAAKPKRKPGRKPQYEAKKDKQIFDAWKSGRYRVYADLAQELHLKRRDVKLAIDRHKKRIKPKE